MKIFLRSSLLIGMLLLGIPVQNASSKPLVPTHAPAEKQAISGRPTRLKIPKIHVDATLEHVGLTPQGALDVPKNPVNAAWYSLGPHPGEQGSAVIDGHFGWWKRHVSGVFNDLSTLQKGDKIYVEDSRGSSVVFVVREIKKYDPSAKATEVFRSSDGRSHLNLITCEGAWNSTSQRYSKRLVVFADRL